MPLTIRTNGSGGSNIIQASWFNDIRDLLTGAMQDQEVSIKNILTLSAISGPPTGGPTAALAAGTALGVGLYIYTYTYANADGETVGWPGTTGITTTTGNQKVNLSGVTVGPLGTTRRGIYRTAVGGGTNYKLVAYINDNTTTTFADTTPDASLGVGVPTSPDFGGTLVIKDAAGAVRMQAMSDGSINQTINPIVINGSTSGTASLYQEATGTIKRVLVTLNNFRNGVASPQNMTIPVPFTVGIDVHSHDMTSFSLLNNGVAQNIGIITALASGGGTVNLVTVAGSYSFGRCGPAADTIQFVGSQASTHTGFLMLEGI